MSLSMRKKTISIILLLVVAIFFYTLVQMDAYKIDTLTTQDQLVQKAIKERENKKTEMNTELKVVNSKGYIERQARLQGFIMPSDMHFVFNDASVEPAQFEQGETQHN